MHQLDGLDNLMIEGEIPGIPLHMCAAMLYRLPPEMDSIGFDQAVRERFESLIDSHFPILRCRAETLPLHLDKSWWVKDEHFHASQHIARVGLPAPRDWNELYRLFAEFQAEPLDMTRPLWQVLVVEGLDALAGIAEGSVALFVKVHHGMMDGKSAVRLFGGMHSLSPDLDSPPIVASMPPLNIADKDYGAPSWWVKYGKAWWHSIERPLDMAATIVGLLPQLWQSHGDAPEEPEHTIPRVRFNHPITPDRVVGHVRINLARLRPLENKYHCTINDLALCVIGGALRDYLLQLNELPTQSLVVAMPIDVRKAGDDGVVGNRVVLSRVSLNTQFEEPVERLLAIHTETSLRKKAHKSNPKGPSLMRMIDEIHPAVILWLGAFLVSSGRIDDLPQPVNAVVSNVPGTPEQVYLHGAQLIDYLGFGPLGPNVGLFHTISSTPDHINISFTSTRNFMGDGSEYRAALERSVTATLKTLDHMVE